METYFYGASNLAQGVDDAFIFIIAVSLLFTVAIVAFMIYMLVHFSRKKVKNPQQFTGNNTLEVVWTVIPLIIVLVMFYVGWVGFKPMREVPPDAMEINAIGRMWAWEFDYGNGKKSNDLVVPHQKNIKLNLISEDVNHSLFIPAFRVKEDVIKGYDNFMWFKPIVKGEFDILCTEYCGLAHSAMLAKVRVVDSLEFKKWLADLKATGNLPDHPGLAIIKANGCLTCHSLNDTKGVGPTFTGLYGSTNTVITDQGEKQIVANDDYLKRSIVDPNAEIVKGFNKGLMQSYQNVISSEDIDKIIDYFRTASEK